MKVKFDFSPRGLVIAAALFIINCAGFAQEVPDDQVLLSANRPITLEGINFPPITLPPGIPPFLLSYVPGPGATGIATNATVSFTFSVAMSPSQSIEWSANVTPGNFSYAWSADAKTLTCTYAGGFPANSAITWTLNPSSAPVGFKAQDGTELFSDIFTGSFTTAASGSIPPPTPCNQPGGTNGGSFTLSKMLRFTQTSSSPPVLDATDSATFSALLNSPTTNPVSSATLKPPTGAAQPLPNVFGNLFAIFDNFNDQAALDAAHPNGAYGLTVTRATGGSVSANVNLSASGFPPTPQVMNFPATQAWDASADFNLLINGLGTPGPNDRIFFEITGPSGLVFMTPDPCVPRTLANTATSILVPKGILGVGQTYSATLNYTKVSGFDSNSIPGIFLYSAFDNTTSFTIRTSGGSTTPPQPPQLDIKQLAGGGFQITLTGDPNVSYVIEGSPVIEPAGWTPLKTVSSPTGMSTHNVPAVVGLNEGWFRAHSAP